MSNIKYPDDWLGQESIALVINYAELSKLVKKNGLNGGHLSYLVRAAQDTVLGTIDRMLSEVEVTDLQPSDVPSQEQDTV